MTKPINYSTAPDPVKYAATGSEDSHGIALCMWAAMPDVRAKYPELKWLFHIPNGGFRTKAAAGKFRAMGVKAGVPDYMLPIKRGEYSGLIIELKRPKSNKGVAGKATDSQGEWLDHFKSQGFGTMVCVGWEAARDCITSYLDYNNGK